jgi:hypothetical protein
MWEWEEAGERSAWHMRLKKTQGWSRISDGRVLLRQITFLATPVNILETRAGMGWMEVCPCLSLDRHRYEGLISRVLSMTSLLGCWWCPWPEHLPLWWQGLST